MKYGMILICMLCFYLAVQFVNAAQEPDKWKIHREDVRMIQKFLKKQGYHPGVSDGLMGPRTEAAVRAYQTGKQLPPDGEVTEGFVNHILSHVRIPDDFYINYTRKSLFSDGAILTINANGQYLVTPASRDPRNPSTRILAKGRLTLARMKMMYVQILSCGVFNKKQQKANPGTVRDGKGYPHRLNDADTITIDITASGKSNNTKDSEYCLKKILQTTSPSIEKYIR